MKPPLPVRFYYGWVIVGVSIISLAAWFGVRGGFSVFLPALAAEFGWQRGPASGVQSVALLAYTCIAPLVGTLIDRHGPRRVILSGLALTVIGLLLCANIASLTQFYIYFGLVLGGGVTAIGLVSYTAILPHWFVARRGLASGLAVSGMGLGVFLVVPLVQWLIVAWDWRTAFVVLAGLYAVLLLPINGLLLRHTPDQVGQRPDGRPNGGDGVQAPEPVGPGWTLARAAGSGRFWALLFFPFFMLMGMYVVLVHFVAFTTDLGVAPGTAAWAFAVMGLMSTLARVGWGWLSDRTSRELTYTLGVGLVILGYGMMAFMASSGRSDPLWPVVIVFGLGWGCSAPMFMATAADLYAGPSIGMIYGLVEGVLGAGAALGGWLAGLIFDLHGGYTWAFIMGAATAVVSCIGMWLAAPRHGPPGQTTGAARMPGEGETPEPVG